MVTGNEPSLCKPLSSGVSDFNDHRTSRMADEKDKVPQVRGDSATCVGLRLAFSVIDRVAVADGQFAGALTVAEI
jgi:hypothetical protein